MSFLKQLLNPFIEFDEEKKKEAAPSGGPAASPPRPAAPGQPPAPDPVTAAVPPPAAGPAVHPLINGPAAPPDPADQVVAYTPSGTLAAPLEEHVRYFEQLIDEANRTNPVFQGTDYKEFTDSRIDIDDITDEALKYRTAFNVLKSTGLTREKLLATGQEYLNLIGRDLNQFQGAHALQYRKEVEAREQVIRKKAEELQALTVRINALKGEINQVTQEITLAKEKLNTTKNSFLLAGELKQREIESELQKIAHYF
ncbi:MAG TPA: hypothetical protein VHK69_14810 [Chitinophagaceae bacterium]|jgi:hypothetical protein|nr:hypothetical protein [Chitinophagaceae bacterium]